MCLIKWWTELKTSSGLNPIVRLKIEQGVYADLIRIYPKPISICVWGTKKLRKQFKLSKRAVVASTPGVGSGWVSICCVRTHKGYRV